MAGSDGAILLTTARWGSTSGHQMDATDSPQVYLHEVVKSGELPQLVRIVKGSYLGLGAPSLPNPSLASTVLVASAGQSLRVAVQCLKFKDNHKTVNVGPKLAIPETFDGFFEILNEDGRAVRCIESVTELARKSPDSCLVRQNVKASWIPSSDPNPDAAILGTSSSSSPASRTISSGELLVLIGEVGRYLRCLDSRGDHVYLPMELRAKFSAVAKEDNQQSISGVHRIRALLNKRLPLTVRMVSGNPPSGLKVGQQFCYEMRLLASFREEMIVAMPLGTTNHHSSSKNGSSSHSSGGDGVVIIPPTVSLKLQLPLNRTSLKASKEFIRMTERCLHQYGLLSDRIQVYDANFSKNLRFDGQHWRVPVPLLLAPLMRRSTSDLIQSITGSGKKDHHGHGHHNNISNQQQLASEELPEEELMPSSKDAEAAEIMPEYDEIDQIYDYIRGFAPLPKTSAVITTSGGCYEKNKESGNHRSHRRNNLYNRVLSAGGKSSSSSSKPIPPPVETIPKNDSASHHTVVTITVNNGNNNPTDSSPSPVAKPRMFRQRSAMQPTSSGKERLYSKNPSAAYHHHSSNHHHRIISPAESKQSLTPSPLFNIRYKSMTNLLAASPADSDTLGSSQSGGRCSGGSAGSAAVRTAYGLRQPGTPGSQQQQAIHHGHHGHHQSSSSRPSSQPHRLFQLHRPKSLTDLLWGRSESRQHPLKIQLHPTVVADVLPASSSSHNRRRHSGTNLLLNGHPQHNKKHHHTTIFYHL